jgi:hypothetical protein
MMAIFYSDNMRKLLIPRINKWKEINSPKQIIKDLVLRHHVNISTEHIKFFENFKPEILLKELFKENPKIFNFDPDKGSGFGGGKYLSKLLKYLDISDISILDAIKTKDGYNKLFYSQYNVIKDLKNPKIIKFGKPSLPKVTKKYLSNTPEVLIIMTKKESDIIFYPEHYYKSTLRFEPEIEYNGVTYLADSLILSNFNTQKCKMGHEIAGVTCNNKRYMYNGWNSNTIDQGIKGKLMQKIACSLMPHDWLDYTKSSFCIDKKNCGLYYHENEKLMNEQLCFSYKQGSRIYTYIRKDILKTKELSPKVKELPPKVKELSPKVKELPVKVKECPPDKILNPKTGRCVNKTGKIGLEIIKKGV